MIPKTGRFTQEDPIGLAGGMNLYGFAGGDPVNFSDPFGLCVIVADCPLWIGGAIAVTKGVVFVGTALAAAYAANKGLNALREAAEEADAAGAHPTADEIISAEKKGSIRRAFPERCSGRR